MWSRAAAAPPSSSAAVPPPAPQAEAEDYATRLLDELGYVGVLALELFDAGELARGGAQLGLEVQHKFVVGNRARQALAEVEQALVSLSSLRERVASTDTAVAGYGQSFQATEARYRVGLASLNELEEARRLKLNADSSAVALQQERINAWIQLYVALGGGFDPVNNPDAFKDPS